MSGESAPKPRLVLCPKCRQLLPESPDYDVYKCGGCGTTLQAKKRSSRAVNSESRTHEADAAPRNSLDLISGDKRSSNGEQLVSPQEIGSREKATSSSSGECSLEGNDGRSRIENGDCNGEQLVTSQENDLEAKATRSSSGECSLNGNGESDQNENSECNGEKLVIAEENGLRAREASSSSGELVLDGNGGRGQIENGECSGEQHVIPQDNDLKEKATRSSSSGDCSLDGNGGRGETGNGECNGEQLGPSNLSGEELENEMNVYKLSNRHTVSNKGYSNEQTLFDIESSAESMIENSVENANGSNMQLEGEELSNANMPSEGAAKQLISALDREDADDEKSALVGVKSEVDTVRSDLEVLNNGNMPPEGAEQEFISGSEEVNHDKVASVSANPEVDINGSNKAESEELNDGNLLLEGTEEELNIIASALDPKNEPAAVMDAKSEMVFTGYASNARRLSAENFVSEKGSISYASPSKHEEGSSRNIVPPPRNIHRSSDRVRSLDTFDNTEVINPCSEISGSLVELSKSPTTRSHHAYDGSISSNDGVDERFPNQHLDSFQNTYAVANGNSEGGSRKGKGLVNSMFYGGLETQQQSYFPNGKHRAPMDSRGNENKVPETTTYGHAHWTRTKNNEFPPKIPHHRSVSHSSYESGSPSNQMHDQLYCSSSYVSPDSFEDPDQEKMKLLRMVYKLQDQLNRTGYVNEDTSGRLSTGSQVSAYQSHELHERRFSHGLDYPRCDGRCSHGINSRQMHNFSQIPYLAEPTSSSHHVDHSCFHCYHQEWQCSAELPPRAPYQHEELIRSHLGHNCCMSYHSHPSTPQWFVTSKLAMHGHETKSSELRHRGAEVNKYFREKEKPILTKRHYRPVAGGAPFVSCHKCFKLLQLPADFLLFKKVCHRLKCGACQEVLKFSLQNGSHIVSYAPNALVPSSSDLDEQNEVTEGGDPNSESHATYYHSAQIDSISYSDDYGHSVSKSYSSEGDPISVTPFNSLNGSVYDNPSVSPATFEPISEERFALSPGTSKAPVETDELAVRSSNVSSETESRSPLKSSPLHQLMGYSSPSLVIRGIPSSVERKETTPKE